MELALRSSFGVKSQFLVPVRFVFGALGRSFCFYPFSLRYFMIFSFFLLFSSVSWCVMPIMVMTRKLFSIASFKFLFPRMNTKHKFDMNIPSRVEFGPANWRRERPNSFSFLRISDF